MPARRPGASDRGTRTPADRRGALEWTSVLEAEYEALYGIPPPSVDGAGDPDTRLRQLHHLLHERKPTALCLSGGGVRSATFGLGVLQGLARAGLLGAVDYLSTVSGGGYVGGWLTTWLHRGGSEQVLRTLADPPPPDGHTGESAVDRLRQTCRYLAPQGGLLSVDRWTLLATMGRNLLLNWLVLLPLIAATLLVPRLYLAAVHLVERNVKMPPPCLTADEAPFWLALLSLGMFVVANGYVVMNFAGRGEGWSQRRFLSFVVVPTLIGAIGLTLFWSAYPCEPHEGPALMVSALLPAMGWLIIGGITRRSSRAPKVSNAVRMAGGARTVIAALVAGSIVGLGAYWFAHDYFDFGAPLGESYAVFAVPAMIGLILLSNTVFLGLASSDVDDAALEWWNRFAAWLAIVASLWLAAAVLVFYLADLVELGVQAIAGALAIEHHASASMMSVGIPLFSSLAGLAARRTTPDDASSRIRALIQPAALPLIIVVLLATVAWFNAWALRGFSPPTDADPAATFMDVLRFGSVLLVLGFVVGLFVPANRFSLHGMYRQRLVRTFLGASHPDRRPNAFTGFDPGDDVRVHELAGVRPLHVINATLNNVENTSYGRNERKAYPFTFTPLHVGSPVLGYRHSCEYGSDGGGPATGLSLGMALAVSGAAASPAMGFYTSKARAFLLTLANARLGLWFGNPSDDHTWQRSDPALGVGPLLRELLGLATDDNPYVYLSDGGHFENLGLWSMVQRRCGVIIVSDAGCDPAYTFDDLSNAVRRIRLDLGIPIEFEQIDMSKARQGNGNAHVAVGTIRYRVVDGPGAPDGLLLYIKATLSGDEPVDIRNFAVRDGAFPHDPTSQQFFDEDRFESYRALGDHSVAALLEVLRTNDARDLPPAFRNSSPALSPFAPDRTAHV